MAVISLRRRAVLPAERHCSGRRCIRGGRDSHLCRISGASGPFRCNGLAGSVARRAARRPRAPHRALREFRGCGHSGRVFAAPSAVGQARTVRRCPRWRPCAVPGQSGFVPDEDVCRFAVALVDTPIRDAVWLATERRQLDGRALWREIARRVPQPYDAAPLFLYGWVCWRDGNGVLAALAAERALASDPGYRAADLLLGAVRHGLDPRRTPRLRLPRPA